MNSVMNIGDHILFLSGGRLAWEGDKAQILNTNNRQLNDFLFSSEILRQVKEQALGSK
jgi:phospholipid/cholesterol/gamma-HCH transport system ATP-binding protein